MSRVAADGSTGRAHPVLVVAGTASGVGKTSVATGLMAALRRAGHSVQGAKVGPDYIDPSYHAVATGRPPRNLDVWLSGPDLIAPLVRHAAGPDADVTVVEGVMGMFDGVRPDTDEGSAAHVASLLGAPVVLVVDASAMARSAAAVVHGFATFSAGTRIAGVVLNRVGSAGHAEMLRTAIEPTGVPVLGALPESAGLATPSRHMGLVPAAERRAEARQVVAALGEWVAAHLDLGAVMALARTARPPAGPTWSPPRAEDGARVGVAVAEGPAFSFRYTENMEVLAAAGADLLPFDPVTDAELPEGADAVYLGGGFPEVHAEALAANGPLLSSLARRAGEGMPVVGECGGLLYLCEDVAGTRQAGVLPVSAAMDGGMSLGYREATAATDSVLWRRGEVVRAHEFHFTACDPTAGEPGGPIEPAWQLDGRHEGFVVGGVHASYLHTHWASTPMAGARLVAAARSWRD